MTEKQKSGIQLAAAVGVIIALVGVLIWWVLFMDNVTDELVIEAGTVPSASQFLIRSFDEPAEFVEEPEESMLHTPGSHPVLIRYGGSLHASILKVQDTVAPAAVTKNLTVFATRRPEAADFIQEMQDATDVQVSYITEPDMTLEGEQRLSLLLTDEGGNTSVAEATLTVVFDETAPVIQGVQEMRNYLGQPVDYLAGVTVEDDLDPDVVLEVYDSQVDLTAPGTYPVVYLAKDACGNTTVLTANITVIHDTQPPAILGLTERFLFVGSSIAYRAGIIVRDDTDSAPVLTVDSSQVDLSTPGTYKLYYHAVDAAGNTSTAETTVTVHEKKANYVEESVIYEEIDRIIGEIITDDMTVKQQVEAIYKWARYSYWYSGYSEKMDWKQAGYKMIKSGYGDCFSFFGAAKLMFERLGIPNIDVRRMPNNQRRTDHFWSMVSVDGGKTYYYFDATPYPGSSARFCLATDAELDAFSYNVSAGYFTRDRSKLPATPTTKPE